MEEKRDYTALLALLGLFVAFLITVFLRAVYPEKWAHDGLPFAECYIIVAVVFTILSGAAAFLCYIIYEAYKDIRGLINRNK